MENYDFVENSRKKNKETADQTASEGIAQALQAGSVGAETDFRQDMAKKNRDAEIAKPLQDANVAYLSSHSKNTDALTTGQIIKNKIAEVYDPKNAELNFKNDTNTVDLNLKYGDVTRQTALEGARANTKLVSRQADDIIAQRDLERKTLEDNKANLAGTKLANDKLEVAQQGDTYNKLADFNPMGVGTSSGDNRKYIDTTKSVLGETPETLLDRTMRLFPGASTERAYKQRTKVREVRDRFATPIPK